MTENGMPSHHGPAAEQAPRTYPNETIQLLYERASCRSFADTPIAADVLETILEAGLHAPSGGNLQPFSIIQIEDAGTRKVLAERCEQSFVGRAPALLLFCLDLHRLRRWAELQVAPFSADHSFRHFWIAFQDTIICAQNTCTAADAMGLGSVYIGTVLEFFAELRQMLSLPQGVFPVVLLCLGYPRHAAQPRRKLSVDVIVHKEAYHELDDEVLLHAFEDKYPNYRVEITEERLDAIARVCRRVHGEAFAEQCLARIREAGYINAVQRYFGLHYTADTMSQGNEAFLQVMKEAGLGCFEPFSLVEEKE
ncbi:MAG TPA: nitroreductase family protein [Anaerolineae bacterium]|nr:nitroreductase family protein [Anaerolineae bacterium]